MNHFARRENKQRRHRKGAKKVSEGYFIELEKREKAEAEAAAHTAARQAATDNLKKRFEEIAAESEVIKKESKENESEADRIAREEIEAELAYKAEKKRLKTEKRKKKDAKKAADAQ